MLFELADTGLAIHFKDAIYTLVASRWCLADFGRRNRRREPATQELRQQLGSDRHQVYPDGNSISRLERPATSIPGRRRACPGGNMTRWLSSLDSGNGKPFGFKARLVRGFRYFGNLLQLGCTKKPGSKMEPGLLFC